MKTKLAIFLLICTTISSAQTNFYPDRELNYPIWPSCEKSSTYIAEQKNCTEEAFATFLRAKINWAEVSTTPIARAQVYLSIDYTGNVSGYGIINCRDTQLAKQMLSALSQVPTGWLPGNQSNIFNSWIDQVQLIDARIYAELFWGTQTLDSLHFYKLIGVARDSYKYYEATAVGDLLDYPGQVEVLIKQLNEDEKISKRLKKKPNVQDSLTLRGMMSSNGLIDSIQIRQSSDNKLTNATIHLLQSIPWTPIDYYGFDQPRIFFAKFGFKRKIRYPKGTELFSIRPNGFMFPDGSAAALRFIHKNLEIPSNLTDSDLVSPIFNVQLFFNPDGHIYYYRFKESVHPIIDQRIAAILVAGPAWETKRMNGKNYRAVMELTYRVQIEP
jgi:hypothetical protein